MLGVPAAQQGYISSNYTHAARDMLARGVNVVLVMVGERGGRYSLSCNPDLTLDVVAGMRASGGAPCMVAGMVNRNLPFMTGDAEVGEEYFDVLVDAPRCEHRLFGVPNPAADPADHAIGLHAAALVKDGGTLQLGIGSLGDSVAHWLRVRHEQPAAFARGRRVRSASTAARELIEREGGLGRFDEGLFGSSEMFTWGLMTLYRAGVIRRRDDERARAAGRVLPRPGGVLPGAARPAGGRAAAVPHDLGGAHQRFLRRRRASRAGACATRASSTSA